MPSVTATSSAPRRRLTAARRRRQLIDVALETFAISGFTATTMEDIATAAGVTKPLLYQHFTSKRALYLELIDDVTARLIAALAAAAGSETSFRRQVESGMMAYFRFAFENQSAVRMLFDSPNDDELARGLHSIQYAIADFVAPLIDADIDDDHRRMLAAAIVGACEEVTRQWLRQRFQHRDLGYEDSADVEAIRMARRVAEFTWVGLRGVQRID